MEAKHEVKRDQMEAKYDQIAAELQHLKKSSASYAAIRR
jgi:hypothetical protein